MGAIGLLGTGAALIIGRAVTLSFVFAVVGVALVAYCFVKLSQHISHTGSVYALCGVTLGPQAGFFAGWALMGAYIAIGCGSTIEIGLFAGNFLNDTFGTHITQWWWLAMIGLAGVAAVAFMEIRVITRALLTSEVIGAILVTILSVVILVKVIFSHGPQRPDVQPQLPGPAARQRHQHDRQGGRLRLPGLRRVRGRGGARGGDVEPQDADPARDQDRGGRRRRLLPAHRGGAVARLRRDRQGRRRPTRAGLPFSDLGTGYIGKWYADILNLMATISLFAISLGVASGGARIMYAQARDAHRQEDRPGRPVQARTARGRARRGAAHHRGST